jgi:hypothetical protein
VLVQKSNRFYFVLGKKGKAKKAAAVKETTTAKEEKADKKTEKADKQGEKADKKGEKADKKGEKKRKASGDVADKSGEESNSEPPKKAKKKRKGFLFDRESQRRTWKFFFMFSYHFYLAYIFK